MEKIEKKQDQEFSKNTGLERKQRIEDVQVTKEKNNYSKQMNTTLKNKENIRNKIVDIFSSQTLEK